jgi:hypothetical protein
MTALENWWKVPLHILSLYSSTFYEGRSEATTEGLH